MVLVQCVVLKVHFYLIILDSSMVEHSAVNRVVVGSSPTRGVFFFLGSMVKRLRHRPFTAVTRVRFPLESFWCYADVAQFMKLEEWNGSDEGRTVEVCKSMRLNS